MNNKTFVQKIISGNWPVDRRQLTKNLKLYRHDLNRRVVDILNKEVIFIDEVSDISDDVWSMLGQKKNQKSKLKQL